MKKPHILCVINDNRDPLIAKMFINSVKKFHPELPIELIDRDKVPHYAQDPDFYYRAKAVIAKDFMKEYDTVIVADADQIMTGDFNHILSLKDYDAGAVLNFNEKDAKEYGLVSVFNIHPQEYINAGIIFFRNERFVEHLYNLCFSKFFPVLQYREQDLLNIICHYGDYKVRVFDLYDPEYDYSAFHGLLTKGWWNKAVMEGDKMMLKKSDVPALLRDTEIKLIHWAGGNANKMNYKIYFGEDCIKRLDYLVSEGKHE